MHALKDSGNPLIGDIPVHWEMVPTRHLCQITTGGEDSGNAVEDGAYPFYVRGREVLRIGKYSFDCEAVLTPGDGQGGTGKVFHYANGRFEAHQRVYVFKDFQRISGWYFYYFLSIFLTPVALAGSSTVTMESLRRPVLADLRVAVPPLNEQRRITDFLDRETGQIDMLIEKQYRLNDTLRERQNAAWANDLDQIAERAPLIQLRRVIESIVDGPFGSSLTSAHYVDSGARVIRLGNIGINEFKDEDIAFISSDYAAELTAHAVRADDVVVAGLGDERMPLGRAAVVPDIGPAIVKADCYRIRPTRAILPEYLAWALSAPPTRKQIALLARGATRTRLNTSVVREVAIPLPPVDTQRHIVEQSRWRLAKMDTLIAETERFIDLSKERRTALITAAVTGQIDVRGEAAQVG